MGPTWETVPKGLSGCAGTRPKVCLMPGMPVKPQGMRIEPPPSVPMCSAPMPMAAAAEAPPLEPPGVVSGFQGLRVTPVSALSVTPFQPNSGVVVLPSSTAPWRRRAATEGASSSDGVSAVVLEPRRVGQPAATTTSFTVVGTPSTRPAGCPARQRASLARAEAKAPSRSTRQKALSRPSCRSIAASAASVASTGESAPLR